MKKLILLLSLLIAGCVGTFAQPPGPSAGIVRTIDGLPTVRQFTGCDATGVTDSTACFNAAIAANAGHALRLSTGTYLVGELDFTSSIDIKCDGHTTKLVRNGAIAANHGWIDVSASNVTIDGCVFEGSTPTSATQDRASIPGSLSTAFTTNSTIWVHGGSLNFTLKNAVIQHSGGYPTILDASAANLDNVLITGTTYRYNRSFLFGSPGDYNYGSYQGGILAYSDSTFAITNSSISNNTFKQNTGHAIFWDARNGNSTVNRNITISHNHFQTIGLDAIENSGISTVTVDGNTMERIGFISTSDSDLLGTARWYNGPAGNVPGIGIDTASLVIGATITNNTMRLVNGGCIDGDGLGDSVVSGNHCSNPMPGDPDYDATVAGQMGPAVYGVVTVAGLNWFSGYNAGNSNNTAQGGANLKILNNSFYGMGSGTIKMYSARDGMVSGNTITLPRDSNTTSDHNFSPPIMIGNTCIGSPTCSATANTLNNNVTIENNKIIYAGSGMFPYVFEDGAYAAYTGAQTNYVHDNDFPSCSVPASCPPFQKNINSSSVSYGGNSTTGSGTTSAGHNLAISKSGSAAMTTVRNQIELDGGGNTLSRWYQGASPTTTSNLLLTLSSSGATYLGNGGYTGGGVLCSPAPACYTGSLWWGSTQLISATQDAYFHSLSDSASHLLIDAARDFHGDSLSLGTAAVAATAAGLTIANDRTAYLAQVFIGTNAASPLKVIDASGNMVGTSFYAGSSVAGATQFAVTATTGTGCTVLAPCVDLGNLHNFIQSSATGASSFAGSVGFGGTINATGLGTVSGGTSPICIDAGGFLRTTGCPPAGTGTLGALSWVQVNSGVAADLQTAICALPAAGGTVTVTANITLSANITSCSKSNVQIEKLEGVVITPGIYNLFNSVPLVSPNGLANLGKQTFKSSSAFVCMDPSESYPTCPAGTRIISQPYVLSGPSANDYGIEQQDATVAIYRDTTDSIESTCYLGSSHCSSLSRNTFTVQTNYGGASGTAVGIESILHLAGNTSGKGSTSIAAYTALDSSSTAAGIGLHGDCSGNGAGSCVSVNAEGKGALVNYGLVSNTGVGETNAANIYIGESISMHHPGTNTYGYGQRITMGSGIHPYALIIDDSQASGTFTHPLVIQGGQNPLPAISLVSGGAGTGSSPISIDFYRGVDYGANPANYFPNKIASLSADTSTSGTYQYGLVNVLLGGGSGIFQAAQFYSNASATGLAVTGTTGQAGVTLTNGYMSSSEGFHTLSTSTTAVNAPNGTIAGRYLTANYSVGSGLGPIINLVNSGGSGSGEIDFYTYGGQTVPSAQWKVSDTGSFSADQIFCTSHGGSSNQPCDTRLSIFGANHTVPGQIVVTGSAANPSLLVSSGYVQSGEGFLTTSFGATAVNVPNGTVSSLYATLNGTFSNTLSIPSGGASINSLSVSTTAFVGSDLTVSGNANVTGSVSAHGFTSSAGASISGANLSVGGGNFVASTAGHIKATLPSGSSGNAVCIDGSNNFYKAAGSTCP